MIQDDTLYNQTNDPGRPSEIRKRKGPIVKALSCLKVIALMFPINNNFRTTFLHVCTGFLKLGQYLVKVIVDIQFESNAKISLWSEFLNRRKSKNHVFYSNLFCIVNSKVYYIRKRVFYYFKPLSTKCSCKAVHKKCVGLSVWPSAWLSVRLSIHLWQCHVCHPVGLIVSLSVHPSACVFVRRCLSACLSFCMSVYTFVVCPAVSLSIFLFPCLIIYDTKPSRIWHNIDVLRGRQTDRRRDQLEEGQTTCLTSRQTYRQTNSILAGRHVRTHGSKEVQPGTSVLHTSSGLSVSFVWGYIGCGDDVRR